MNKKVVFILILLTLLLYARPFWQWFQAKTGTPVPSFRVVSALPGEENEPPFMKEEFIGPPGEMQVHAASLAELEDGTLAAVWYGGEYEGSKDTRIYFTTRVSGEEGEWSIPRGIVDRVSAGKELKRYIKIIGNPLIFAGPGDRLWLLYVSVSVGGWSGSSLNVTVSKNRGKTWSPGRRLTLSPFLNISELVRGGPLPLTGGGGGGFVVPIYHECIGIFSELLWLFPESDGTGLNYRKTRLTWGKRFLQPTIVALSPDSAVAFHRSHSVRKNIGMSFSEDVGETWTAPGYIELPNPDAGIAALLLSDRRVLLAYNHHRETRENLCLAVSDKDLRSWRRLAVLEDTPGEEFSYPYMLPTGDGKIHLVYTWQRKRIKHVILNEAWLHSQLNREPVPYPGNAPGREAPLPLTPYPLPLTFSFLFPFLLLMLSVQSVLRRLGKSPAGWSPTVIVGLFSALAVVVPVGGLPLARWVVSLNANFSIPLTAVVLHRVWKNASGTALLDGNALRMGWIFGGIAGLVLYPMALGLGSFDPYSQGWEFAPLFVVSMVLTVFLLVKKNRFGVVLVFCILGFNLHVLESSNLWDYLIDPFFVMVSFAALVRRFVKFRNRRDNRIDERPGEKVISRRPDEHTE